MKTLFAALAIAAAVPAFAAASPEPVSRIVAYGDLDLATPAGRRALETRLAAAARDVCGSPVAADPRGRDRVLACRVAARGQAAPILAFDVAAR